MNWLQKVYIKAESYFLTRADERLLRVHAVARSGSESKAKLLTLQPETLQSQSLKEYKLAIMMATDPIAPDRAMLWTLYKNLLLDNHLSSVIDSRILFSQRSPIKIVNEAGDKNPDLTWFFERTWHEELVRLILRFRTEGTKLIELFDIDPITGELAQVTEIPMPHFNAKKGLILKAPGDQTGWPYREGALSGYYIQIGKDDDLGMLAEMTPAILAKKLGFGSWLDYIEKYGVGNLFITTDREDNERLSELYEAARNFKSSGFMVGRGQERFEIKGGDAGNPQNFDLLIGRINDEISKRLLGGAGLTDEKAFVGSAEIQFRLAKDRFESDKLLVKNIYNQHVIPRLIQLSPVYAPLQGHYFDWDNSETQTLDEITKLITALAPYFELDTEEISQKTGLTILGQKSATPVATPQDAEVKKKSVNER